MYMYLFYYLNFKMSNVYVQQVVYKLVHTILTYNVIICLFRLLQA